MLNPFLPPQTFKRHHKNMETPQLHQPTFKHQGQRHQRRLKKPGQMLGNKKYSCRKRTLWTPWGKKKHIKPSRCLGFHIFCLLMKRDSKNRAIKSMKILKRKKKRPSKSSSQSNNPWRQFSKFDRGKDFGKITLPGNSEFTWPFWGWAFQNHPKTACSKIQKVCFVHGS